MKRFGKALIKNQSIAIISVSLIPRYIRLLVWVLGIKSNRGPFFLLGERIISLHKNSGSSFTVKYLKECLRIIQKFISGEKLTSSMGIHLGITRGLPSFLPKELRSFIRNNSEKEIRAILTIISIFRVLKCAPSLKLNTITDKFSGTSEYFNPMEVKVVMKLLPEFTLQNPRFLMLRSAGPNKNPSSIGLPLDAYAFYRNPVLLGVYSRLAERLNGHDLLNALLKEISIVKNWFPLKEPILAKLSFINEPAGKVRVVAIVDGWTQSLLSGLHDSISDLLSKIEQDGTFDQAGPLRNLIAKGHLDVFSFDLSAATDRLPIKMQIQILSNLIGLEAAKLWASLLVDRDYKAYSREHNVDSILRYAVGQPMGCLSSFNMLALSHHIIVQIAARRVGFDKWFEDYALLGDDIVIANKLVAMAYAAIMKDLGMEINPHKSLTSSKGVCEFAKRLISPSFELTPIGPKNLVQAMKSHNMIPSLFLDMIGKGMKITQGYCEERFKEIPKTFVKGRKNLPKSLLWAVQGPFGFISSGTRLTSETQAVNTFNPLWLGNLLARIRFTMYKIHSKQWENSIKVMMKQQHVVETEWPLLEAPGFSQSPLANVGDGKVSYWFKSLKNIWVKQDISWGQLPSYQMILEKYSNALDNMWRIKPYVPLNLTHVDMLSVYMGKDVITPEFCKESPVSAVLTDLFVEPDMSLITKRDISRPANEFWKEFSKVEFDNGMPSLNPVRPNISPNANITIDADGNEIMTFDFSKPKTNAPLKFGGGFDFSKLAQGA